MNDKWVASNGTNSNFSFDGETTLTLSKSISELQNQGWIVNKNGVNILTTKHDAAEAQWGGDWRMPTKSEWEDIDSKCDWLWTTKNGVYGYLVRGRGDYSSASIFLPCTGYGCGALLEDLGSHGYYWSSVPCPDYNHAWYLEFYPAYPSTDSSPRYCGQSIRPVQDVAKQQV